MVAAAGRLAIKTQKQISYSVPHAQREQAPPPVLRAVV